MKHQAGVTLLELVVASALMGLLFFSGLQLLSACMTVQQSVIQSPHTQWAGLRLLTFLKITLAGIGNAEIQAEGKTLLYDSQRQLTFQHDAVHHQWQLVEKAPSHQPSLLYTWSEALPGRFAFAWQDESRRLLNIYLGNNEPALTLWLRNSA